MFTESHLGLVLQIQGKSKNQHIMAHSIDAS